MYAEHSLCNKGQASRVPGWQQPVKCDCTVTAQHAEGAEPLIQHAYMPGSALHHIQVNPLHHHHHHVTHYPLHTAACA
jgi:hypothetical protein